MPTKEASLRDQLRAKTLGSGPKRREEKHVIDGETFIVKQPTVADRGDILKASKVGGGAEGTEIDEMQVVALIRCVYTEDGERVFEDGDYDALMEMPSDCEFIDTLSNAALGMMNAAVERGKASAATANSSSSSESAKS